MKRISVILVTFFVAFLISFISLGEEKSARDYDDALKELISILEKDFNRFASGIPNQVYDLNRKTERWRDKEANKVEDHSNRTTDDALESDVADENMMSIMLAAKQTGLWIRVVFLTYGICYAEYKGAGYTEYIPDFRRELDIAKTGFMASMNGVMGLFDPTGDPKASEHISVLKITIDNYYNKFVSITKDTFKETHENVASQNDLKDLKVGRDKQ